MENALRDLIGERPPISVIIPSWNGAALLRRNLPIAIAELDTYNRQSEFIVVDNASTDDSVSWMRGEFPQVRVIERPRNSGFSAAINEGVAASRNDVLLLLNNDVQLTPGTMAKLVARFKAAPDTFAVAPVQASSSARAPIPECFQCVRWEKGFYTFEDCTAEVLRNAAGIAAIASGACCLCAKRKLLDIGGLCELFDPFYYEDSELSVQAIKRGWTVAFCTDATVYHDHGTTSRRRPFALRFVPIRNFLFLHWLTIDTRSLWLSHVVHLARRLVLWSLQGRIRFAIGFVLAALKVPAVLQQRKRRSAGWLLTSDSALADARAAATTVDAGEPKVDSS